jgi:DNA-binding PadR family transcriptional regulator
MHSTELLKGTLQTIILKLLQDNGKMYGYEITQKVKSTSEESIMLTEGALYPALHKMEAEGLLTTEKVKLGKRVRKYYTLTETGNTLVTQKVKEFAAFIKTMNTVLQLSPA